MFSGKDDSSEGAKSISDWLADHKSLKSHGRHLSRSDLEEHQLAIDRLEADKTLQDLSLSVFHAATRTFSGTPAVKIVEGHTGRAFIKQFISQPPPPQEVVQEANKLGKAHPQPIFGTEPRLYQKPVRVGAFDTRLEPVGGGVDSQE